MRTQQDTFRRFNRLLSLGVKWKEFATNVSDKKQNKTIRQAKIGKHVDCKIMLLLF